MQDIDKTIRRFRFEVIFLFFIFIGVNIFLFSREAYSQIALFSGILAITFFISTAFWKYFSAPGTSIKNSFIDGLKDYSSVLMPFKKQLNIYNGKITEDYFLLKNKPGFSYLRVNGHTAAAIKNKIGEIEIFWSGLNRMKKSVEIISTFDLKPFSIHLGITPDSSSNNFSSYTSSRLEYYSKHLQLQELLAKTMDNKIIIGRITAVCAFIKKGPDFFKEVAHIQMISGQSGEGTLLIRTAIYEEIQRLWQSEFTKINSKEVHGNLIRILNSKLNNAFINELTEVFHKNNQHPQISVLKVIRKYTAKGCFNVKIYVDYVQFIEESSVFIPEKFGNKENE